MKLTISSAAGRPPVYAQIYEQISAQILSGDLVKNERLPSIRGIANELKISVITVKNAYEMLERDGFIYTEQGKGCFVAAVNAEEKADFIASEKLRSDLRFYKNLGLTKEQFQSLIEKIW